MTLHRCLAALVAVVALSPGASVRMDGAQQTTPRLETTDGPRRVPVPPVDRRGDPVIVLRGATLIDGTGGAPVPDAVVVIQGDRILAAGPGATTRPPAGASREIDLTGLFVVPGLIDLHVHFRQQRGDDFELYRDSDAAAAIRGVEKLGRLLDGGITAVRDAGTRGDVALAIKEAVERRIVDGPRVFWSGRMIAMRGGHSDEITETATGRPRSLETNPGTRVATGPYDWRLAVREQIRAGADWIKLTAPFTRDEVAAAIDEAHLQGIRVTADAFGPFVTQAVEAGIDCIEHPLAITDEGVAAMARKGTAFVPTLTAFYNVVTTGYPAAHIPPGGFYYTMSRRFVVSHEAHLATVRKAHAAGVRIGVGTDIPFEGERRYPSDYFTELKLLRDAGLSDADVLAAATRVGADILGIGDLLGTIAPGRIADLLVVGGNPLTDVLHLRDLRLLVADGRVVRDRRAAAN